MQVLAPPQGRRYRRMETLAKHSEAAEDQDSSERVRPLVYVALTVFAVVGSQVLTLLRSNSSHPSGEPEWGLPRRPLQGQDTLETVALRELSTLTSPAACHLEQLYTRGEPESRTGDRELEVAYLVLTPPPAAGADGNGEGGWWSVSRLPRLADGHGEILVSALKRLRGQLAHTNIGWSLLPAEFSLSELQAVYEAIGGRTLDKRNFRKWVLTNGLVEATAHERRDGAHRPARLYRFTTRELRTLE